MRLGPKLKNLATRAGWLLAAFAALTVILNLPWLDEELNPAALEALTPRPVSMTDNAYAYLHGFGVPADRDPMEFGQNIVRELRDRYYRGERMSFSAEERGSIYGDLDLDDAWIARLPGFSCDRRRTTDCADRLIRSVAEAQPLGPRVELLLERYEELLRLPQFEPMMEDDAGLGGPPYVILLSRISRVSLALSYSRDTPDRFLERARSDIRFWSQVWNNDAMLNVAVPQMHYALDFIAALVRSGQLSDEQLATTRRTIELITEQDWDLRSVGLSQFATYTRAAEASADSWTEFWGSPGWYMSRPIISLISQRNASLNDYFELSVQPRLAESELSAPDYYEIKRPITIMEFIEHTNNPDPGNEPPPALFLYNLGGRFQWQRYARITGALETFTRTTHDLKGRAILGLLQIEISMNPGSDVREIIEASEFRNPYTSEPMEYDEVTGVISFPCLFQSNAQLCSVALGSTND